jgi:hypothetical protein
MKFFFLIKTSLFISLCILRDIPQQKIPRELCGGGDGGDLVIFLCSRVPMERFFDGTDKENLKNQEEMDRSGKLRKTRKERMEERERRDFYISGGFHTRVFSINQERPWGYHPCATLPRENPLVWEPPLQHFSSPKL